MNIKSRQSVQAGDNAYLSWLDRGNIDKGLKKKFKFNTTNV
jgi:hypothetical protein